MKCVTLGLAAALAACGPPDVCGTIEIRAVTGETMHFDTDGDGDLDLVDFCGTDYGAFGIDRPDYDMMIVSFDASAPDNEISSDGAISRNHLPAAQIVFLNKHLVPGTHLTMANIAGNGLHKQDAATLYQVYPLTAATIDILGGPYDREEDTFDGETSWREEWEMSWDLEFGGGVEHWTGRDRVSRSDGNDIGTPVSVPPDYRPD